MPSIFDRIGGVFDRPGGLFGGNSFAPAALMTGLSLLAANRDPRTNPGMMPILAQGIDIYSSLASAREREEERKRKEREQQQEEQARQRLGASIFGRYAPEAGGVPWAYPGADVGAKLPSGDILSEETGAIQKPGGGLFAPPRGTLLTGGGVGDEMTPAERAAFAATVAGVDLPSGAWDVLSRESPEQWVPVYDDKGQVVAQRSTTTGKISADPRYKAPDLTTAEKNALALGYPRGSPEFDEYVRAATLPDGGGGTETQQAITELVMRGYSPNDAQDIARGRVTAVGPDAFGDIYLVNRATGEKRLAVGAPSTGASGVTQAPAPGETGAPAIPAPQPAPQRSAEEAARRGTGPWANLAAALDATVGGVFDVQMFPETTENRNHLRLVNKTIQEGLIQNPKFPVAEQQFVLNMLPDPDKFWRNPQAQSRNMAKMRDWLSAKKVANAGTLTQAGITMEERGRLADQNAAIDRILGLMGPRAAEGDVTDADRLLIEKYLSPLVQ